MSNVKISEKAKQFLKNKKPSLTNKIKNMINEPTQDIISKQNSLIQQMQDEAIASSAELFKLKKENEQSAKRLKMVISEHQSVIKDLQEENERLKASLPLPVESAPLSLIEKAIDDTFNQVHYSHLHPDVVAPVDSETWRERWIKENAPLPVESGWISVSVNPCNCKEATKYVGKLLQCDKCHKIFKS